MKVYDYEGCEDYYSSEFLEDEFADCKVTIDQMREMYEARKKEPGSYNDYDIDLHTDADTGLLYSNHKFSYCGDLLLNHLIAEQLYADKDKVDWEHETNHYNFRIIETIHHLIRHPLVWVPTQSVAHKCVVKGQVAKEIAVKQQYEINAIYSFCAELERKGLLWFADNLPTADEFASCGEYYDLPKDMVLWDRLIGTKGYESRNLHANIDEIAETIGPAKAIEIITRFREDWPDINLLGLFGFDKKSDEEIESFRRALFEELDRSMRIWQRDVEAAQQQEQPSIIPTCRYIDFDKLAQNGIYTPEQFTTMLRQACEQDAKALGAFLKKYFKMGYLDFHGDNKKKIYEHLKECFPGTIKYSYPNFTQYFD